jgi:small subunit ribosomal protein S20
VANHESALKAHKQSEERRLRNRQYRTQLRHSLRDIRASIENGDTDAAKASLSKTVSLIDKLVGKGIIHDNAGSRYKSRLMKQLSNATASPAA